MPITAYMHKIQLRPFVSANPEEGRPHIPRLLSAIYDRFKADYNLSFFSYRIQSLSQLEDGKDPDQLIMDNLRFNGVVFFGTIGIAKKEMISLIRQRNPDTMEQVALTTTSPGLYYEYYTFFALCAKTGRLLLLRNTDLPSYTARAIVTILNIALNKEPYSFELSSYSESSILRRLKEMKATKLSIVVDSNEFNPNGLPSMGYIDRAATKRTKCTVSTHYKFKSGLTDEVVDNLLTLKEEGGIKTLVVAEDKSPSDDPDKIDLLKEILLEKRKLPINKEQSKDADLVHEHMIRALNVQTE